MRPNRFLLLLVDLALTLTAACGGAREVATPAETPAEPAPAEGIILDDRDERVELDGVWWEVAVDGAYGDGCLWAPPNPTVPNDYGSTEYAGSLSACATIRPDLPRTGTYEILVHWCAPATAGEPIATVGEIQVHPTHGFVAYTAVQANMTQTGDAWISLGRFYLEKDGSLSVSNLEGPNNGAVVLDAFQFIFRTAGREALPPSGPPLLPPPQPSPTPSGAG